MFAACTGGSADTTTTAASTTSAPTTTAATTTTTQAPTVNGEPITGIGDDNATAFALQFLMNCAGYGPLEVDGQFGPATKTAVQAMQVDLGREETGAPDDETFALLSRACADPRRLAIDGGQAEAVGNVSAADPDTYFVRAEEDQRIGVVVTSSTGRARVDVRGADGGVLAPAAAAAWAGDVPSTQDYVVDVSTAGDATTYAVRISILTPGTAKIAPAAEGTVVVDGHEEAVSRVCLDTAGDQSFVAESGSGYLVVAVGTPGDFAFANGGVGAWVEVLYRDGSAGYVGFPIDLDASVTDRVVGVARVYPSDGSAPDKPVSVAFDVTRSAAPCEGGAATPIVLTPTGLEVVDFGADADQTLALVRQAMPGAAPTEDTGWIAVDDYESPYGLCRSDTTMVRVATIENLALYFTDGATSWAPKGTRHFAGYQAGEGVFPFVTGGGAGPGSAIGDVLDAHPDAGVGLGLDGGFDVFITSPVGADGWLRAMAPDAIAFDDMAGVITAVRGGRFCDQ